MEQSLMANNEEENDPTGFVLPAVLLAIVALTIVVAAIIGAAKRSNDTFVLTRTQLEDKLKLEGALFVVTAGLINNPEFWPPRQTPYALTINNDAFEVRLQASAGLVDLNTAQPADLARFFLLAGADQETAVNLADKIADWRDADSLVRLAGAERPDYQTAKLPRPKDGYFTSIKEIAEVMGFDAEIAACLEPFITVDSGLPQIVSAYAPPSLASLANGQAAGPTPSLSVGNSVEIEIRRPTEKRTSVLTAVVRTTGQKHSPLLVHGLEMTARPNRDDIPSCFAQSP
jgi:Type II secretion system (T2SS), protein K